MNKAIIVSGTPGTGKSEVAKKIAEHFGYEYIHIGESEEYVVAETDVKIIDVEQMVAWLKKKQNTSTKGLVIDSHLSHYFPSERTRMCIILRCNPSELKARLKRREYPDYKIEINLEAEAMDLILQEALAEGHKVHEVDTTHKTSTTSAREAINAIEQDKATYGNNDYSYYLTNKK